MKLFSKLSTAFLLLAVGLCFGGAINAAATANAEAELFAACEASRISDSVSEQYCGDLQDKYGIKYLCEQRSKSPNNYCWTEAK